MFSKSPAQELRDYRSMASRNQSERQKVLYLADLCNLAIFHKRPKVEVDNLLYELKQATQVKES